MLDINGQPLRAGDTASLLCEILAADEDGVRVRVMNSDTEYIVGVKHDEVLGGLVADSELTLFEAAPGSRLPAPDEDLAQPEAGARKPEADSHG